MQYDRSFDDTAADAMEPTAAELAATEAELPEWECLRVQEYWAAVVDEELEAAQPVTTSYRWSVMGSGERQRHRRVSRRTESSVLRLIVDDVEAAALTAVDDEEEAA